MHISRFTKPFVFSIAITLILSVFSGIGWAQQQNLMPPVPIPQPNVTIATPQIRIIDARLAQIGLSHAFEVTFEPYLWQGLDEEGNPITYNYPKGSEIVEQKPAQSFERYSKELTAFAKIFLDYGKEEIVYSKVAVLESNKPTTIRVGLIQANQRILPGLYRINIEIPIKNIRGRNRDNIWIEESRLNLNNYSDIIRVNPKRAQMLTASTAIVVSKHENKVYSSLRVGAVNYYSSALKKVESIKQLEKSIEDFENKLKEAIEKEKKEDKDKAEDSAEGEPGVNVEALQLQFTINKLKQQLREAQFFQKNVDEIKTALTEETKNQEEMGKYLAEYHKQLRTACIEITNEIREMYLEMWWTGNLCLPNWAPSEKYGTLEEVRKKWKISRFLEGDLSSKEVHGNWKKEEWLKWMKEEWMPKLEGLHEKFRLFFGDQSLPKDDRWYYGLTENMQETFWVPKQKNAYNEMKSIFVLSYMENFAKGTANLLAQYHTKKGEKIDYPFTNEEMSKASPAPLSSKVYYNRIKRARSEFLKAFAPKQDPTVRPDLTQVKKRKYYVSKDGLYIGPLEYDPVTGERNDGPYDESILNPTDQPGE